MTTAPLTPAPAADRTSQIQDALTRAVNLGDRLLKLAVDQAEAGTLSVTAATKDYERVTRAQRRCGWVVHRLDAPAKTVDRVAARKQIIRTVEDNIQRHDDEDTDAERLHEELMDRMDTDDLEEEIGNRPVADIITDIVRDLGLAAVPGNHPWKRRTPKDVATLCARAAQPVPKAIAAAPVPGPNWPKQVNQRQDTS